MSTSVVSFYFSSERRDYKRKPLYCYFMCFNFHAMNLPRSECNSKQTGSRPTCLHSLMVTNPATRAPTTQTLGVGMAEESWLIHPNNVGIMCRCSHSVCQQEPKLGYTGRVARRERLTSFDMSLTCD